MYTSHNNGFQTEYAFEWSTTNNFLLPMLLSPEDTMKDSVSCRQNTAGKKKIFDWLIIIGYLRGNIQNIIGGNVSEKKRLSPFQEGRTF